MQMPLGLRIATLLPLWILPLILSLSVHAQDDDDWGDEDEEEYEDEDDDEYEDDEYEDDDSSADSDESEEEWEEDGAEKPGNKFDQPSPEKAKAMEEEEFQGDFDAVIATDREPRPGTPLISAKRYPMGFRFEGSLVADIGYSKALTSQYGGHGAMTLHLADWLAVEGFAGLSYPQESQITEAVRLQGKTRGDTGIPDPVLSDLWQSFAIGGLDLQWAPLYGKLSFVSEQDLSFQFYFVGGASVEGIAKPLESAGDLNADRDFWNGLVSGKQFTYNVRPSIVYGAGVRLIPWQYFAVRLEARNFTGLQPAVARPPDGTAVKQFPWGGARSYDVTTMPTIQIGLSFLI